MVSFSSRFSSRSARSSSVMKQLWMAMPSSTVYKTLCMVALVASQGGGRFQGSSWNLHDEYGECEECLSLLAI